MSKNKEVREEIIDLLNELLEAELVAINQYFLHAEICEHWGYDRLYQFVRQQAIGEMKHAEQVMGRILFLDGVPVMKNTTKIHVGKTVLEQLQVDLALEQEAVRRLNRGIELCHKHVDHGTKALLESILLSEEEHIDWLDAQLKLIEQVGAENYLATQIHT